MKKLIEKRIAAGIAFLNVAMPGWLKKIKVKELDLSESNTCVIGELYGDYGRGVSELGLSSDAAEKMGFYEGGGFFGHDTKAYKALTAAWKKAIAKLRRR